VPYSFLFFIIVAWQGLLYAVVSTLSWNRSGSDTLLYALNEEQSWLKTQADEQTLTDQSSWRVFF